MWYLVRDDWWRSLTVKNLLSKTWSTTRKYWHPRTHTGHKGRSHLRKLCLKQDHKGYMKMDQTKVAPDRLFIYGGKYYLQLSPSFFFPLCKSDIQRFPANHFTIHFIQLQHTPKTLHQDIKNRGSKEIWYRLDTSSLILPL